MKKRLTIPVAVAAILLVLAPVAWAAYVGPYPTRVPFYGTSSQIMTDAALTFTKATGTLSATKFSGAHNGTVGATTPATGAFTTLSTTGATSLGTSLAFAKELSHTINVTTTTADDTAGGKLTVAAGTGNGTGNGGNLALNAGGTGSGTAGVVEIGVVGSAVTITPATTITGLLTCNGGISGNLAAMTTLGDLIYGGTAGALTRLAGNTTATQKFLAQTGTGSVSAAPSWVQPTSTDISDFAAAAQTQAGAAMVSKSGTATLTSGAVTVAYPSVTANTRIFVSGQSTTGACYVKARSVGVSFDIYSTDVSDSGTAAYIVVEP